MSGKDLFDGYMAVDWSANGVPKKGADSIWICCTGWGGPDVLENPSTRTWAMVRIDEMLQAATAADRRLLCGFDFPFGYPEGTARALTGKDDWQAVWALLAEIIEDGPQNENNRFDAAAQLNASFEGEGPFYFNGLKRDIDGLPRKKPDGYGAHLPSAARHAEIIVKGAQETWKLGGTGSVGSQALMGIAALERLRQQRDVAIWPFETLGEGRSHVLAEIYPSLAAPAPGHEIKDAGQVKSVVTALRNLDASGDLSTLLHAPAGMPREVRREEACILGMNDQGLFRNAARTYLRAPKAIYARSFATVRAEADLDRFPADMAEIAVRLIHACGMVDICADLEGTDDCTKSARDALANGAPILCDCEMVASGVIRRGLRDNDVICTLNDPQTPDIAKRLGTTRSAAATELWPDHLKGAIVAVGNAPTALFHLLEGLDRGWPEPAAILAFPVGFVGAQESKAELAANPRGIPFLTLHGRRGGSAMASAAVNAMALGLRGDGL